MPRKTKILTLVLVVEHPHIVGGDVGETKGKWRILLGMKKRGFGKGKWNGFGG